MQRGQGAAVDAHEQVAEFVFQGLERFVDQHVAAGMVHRHVFLVGLEVAHFLHRHQLQAAVGAGAEVAAAAALVGGHLVAEFGDLHPVEGAGLIQRALEVLGAHRLEQIIHRVHTEGLQGVFFVGGAEDHRRRVLHLVQVGGGFQAVHVGHANVHQHHVRAQPPGALHRFAAAGGFRADFHVGHLHQTFQAHSGQGLVVADQDLHFRDVVHGFPFFLFTRFFYWSG